MSEVIVNPFDSAGYDMATMTEAVNLIPNNYGRVRQLGIFTPSPVSKRMIGVEETNGLLTLLPSLPVGAPPTQKQHAKAVMRPFIIPHIPYSDQIRAEDLQGMREPGTMNPKTLQVEMTSRLTEMRAAHAITEEYMMLSALKGTVVDGAGSTVYNLYTEFGISAKSVDFALDEATTKVPDKCREVVRHIEDNLLGDVMTDVHCLCHEDFFDALVEHDSVSETFLNWSAAQELAGRGGDIRKGFRFGGITFEEYRGAASNPSGGTTTFIGSGAAHFFPVGTNNTFKIHYAPANYLETVNTLGQAIFAKQTMEAKGRWVDIDTESNPLPLCRRPGLLVTGAA